MSFVCEERVRKISFVTENINKNLHNMDMHDICEFKYNEYRLKANITHEIKIDEFNKWYDSYCGKCKYMCEICMYGEE